MSVPKRYLTGKTLPDIFWGDDGEWIIVAEDGTAYGRFYSDFIASAWAGDMNVTDQRLGNAQLKCKHQVRSCLPPLETLPLDNEDYIR